MDNIKKTEFSKLIMWCAMATNAFVVAFTAVMVWRTNDLIPLAYLIPSVAAELAAGSGFYYRKAEKENLVKLQRKNPNIPILTEPHPEKDIKDHNEIVEV